MKKFSNKRVNETKNRLRRATTVESRNNEIHGENEKIQRLREFRSEIKQCKKTIT